MARVTVGLPTRNRAHWLGGAIESVLAQSFTDFELVVADNASTDGTPDVVAGYADPRVRYERRDEDVGMRENHNLLFRASDSEYLLVLPDDDRLHPELLARTVAALDRHPRAGMVHTGFTTVAADGTVEVPHGNWTGGLERDTRETGLEFIDESMMFSCRVCASTALMRAAAMPPDFFREEDFPAIDFGFWLRMALDWDMLFLADALGTYRIHGASHSSAPGVGAPVQAGYVQGFELIDKLLEIKLRFLARHGDRLPDVPRLRDRAAQGRRRELLNAARLQTLPARRLRPTARALGAVVRHEPRMAADVGAIRLLGASVLGRRITERVLERVS